MNRNRDGEASQFCKIKLMPPVSCESVLFVRVAIPDETVLSESDDNERGQAILPDWSLVVQWRIFEPFVVALLERLVQ